MLSVQPRTDLMNTNDIQLIEGKTITDTKAKLAYTVDGNTTVVAVAAGWSVFQAQADGSRTCVMNGDGYAAPLTNLQRGIETVLAALTPSAS